MKINRDTEPTTAADRLATVTLQPRHWKRDETLPPLTVTPPRRGGWTPERAAKVARAYAREHGLSRFAAERAYRAISLHDDPCPAGRDPRLWFGRLDGAVDARARWRADADGKERIRAMFDPSRP